MNELIIEEDMATVQNFLKNDKWVKRIDATFSTLDLDKSGYLSAEDWMSLVDNLGKIVSDRPNAIAKLRNHMSEFLIALGLTKGIKVDKKKFRELVAAFDLAETEKMKRGEMTWLEKYNNAMFDVVDTNRDGFVTFEEYKLILGTASNAGEEEAKATFNLLDKNKNGKIERKEFISSNLKFWYTLDDSDTKGMFGDKFE